MAKTVGLPAAMGTELLLGGRIQQGKGVIRPMHSDFYVPIMKKLGFCGINFHEKSI